MKSFNDIPLIQNIWCQTRDNFLEEKILHNKDYFRSKENIYIIKNKSWNSLRQDKTEHQMKDINNAELSNRQGRQQHLEACKLKTSTYLIFHLFMLYKKHILTLCRCWNFQFFEHLASKSSYYKFEWLNFVNKGLTNNIFVTLYMHYI